MVWQVTEGRRNYYALTCSQVAEGETIIGGVRKAKDGSDIYSYKFKVVK